MPNRPSTKKTPCPRCGGLYKALSMHANKLSCRKRQNSIATCRASVKAMGDRKHCAFRMRSLVSGGQLPGAIAAAFFARNPDMADPLGFVWLPDGDNLNQLTQLCTGPRNLIDYFSFLSALKGETIRKLDPLTRHVVRCPTADLIQGLLVHCLMFLETGLDTSELTEHNFLYAAKAQSRWFSFDHPRNRMKAEVRNNIYRTLLNAQKDLG